MMNDAEKRRKNKCKSEALEVASGGLHEVVMGFCAYALISMYAHCTGFYASKLFFL